MKNKFLKIAAMSMALVLAMPMNVFAADGLGYYECSECNHLIPVSPNVHEYMVEHMNTEHACISNLSKTPINLSNSIENIATDILDKTTGTDYFADEDTNVWQNSSIVEETRVTVQRTSTFEIIIPKEIVLDGSTGTADYKVKVNGDIAGDQKITVTPDASFALSEVGGKANVTATVTQPNTEYDYVKLQGEGTEYDGNISATLTAGEWSGKFNFNIEFKNKNEVHEHNFIQNDSTYVCSECGVSYSWTFDEQQSGPSPVAPSH